MKVDPQAKAGWEAVRSDRDQEHWMIARVSDDGKSLDHIETSTGGVAELAAKLQMMKGIIYSGLRVNAVDERGSVTSVRFRFVMISMITDDVPVIKRAKAGMAKGLADELFNGTSVYLTIDHADELTRDAIKAKLEANCGAHRPSGYEFDGIASPSYSSPAGSPLSPKPPVAVVVSQDAQVKEEPAVDNKVDTAVEKEETQAKQEETPVEKKEETQAKQEETPVEKKEETQADKTFEMTEAKPTEASVKEATPSISADGQLEGKNDDVKEETVADETTFESEPPMETVVGDQEAASQPLQAEPPTPAVTATSSSTLPDVGTDAATAWKRVQDDKDTLNWVMLSFDKQPMKTIVLGAGEGGLEEFKSHLQSDRVIFGGLRCKAIDDRGSVKSIRTKLIFVQQNGDDVKAMVRAAAGPARGHYESVLAGTHISVNISGPEDLEESDLVKRLQSSCGAHAPTGYDFS